MTEVSTQRNIYKLFKKRGFAETLKILGDFENGEAVQKRFFKRFDAYDSYYNAYLRVKPYLTKYHLIDFKCKQDGTKVIYLTEKGQEVLAKLEEIENLIMADTL